MATYKWEVENQKVSEVTTKYLVLKEDGAEVAKITTTGLAGDLVSETGDVTDVISTYLEVTYPVMSEGDSPTVTTRGVIKLKEAALAKNGASDLTITLTSTNYNLDLDGADASTHVLQGDAIPAAWTATRASSASTSTATHTPAGTPESWTLVTGDNPKTITYAKASIPAADVVISGLAGTLPQNLNLLNGDNSAIVIAAAAGGSDKGTITIAASVLPTGSVLPTTQGQTATVTLGTGSDNYNLKLNEDVAKFDATKGTATVGSIAEITGTPATKKATITRTQSAGWLEGTDGTAGATLTYKPLTTKTIATVSGLNADLVEGTGANAGKFGTLTTAGDPSTFVEAVTVNETTVTLAKGALGTAAISIADATDNGTAVETDPAYSNFKLALADPNSDGTVGFEVITPYWEYTSGTTTATYKSGKKEGWTLASENKSIITHTAQADTTLATLTNLNTGIDYNSTTKQIKGITVDGDTITLAEDVLTLNTNATTLAQGTNVDNTTTSYTLALATGVATSAAKGDITLTKHASDTSSVEVKQALAEYWTLDGLTVSHTDATSQTLATITGLNTNKDIEGDDATVKLGDTSGSEITITVEKGALATTDVTVTPTEASNDHTFKFALGTGISAPDKTPHVFKLDTALKDGTGTNAGKTLDVLGTFRAGYELTENGTTIDYTAETDKTLATVINLDPAITTSTLASYIALDHEHKLVRLNAGAITTTTDGNKATIVNVEKVEDYTPEYKLGFLDGDTDATKVKRFDTAPTTFALDAVAEDTTVSGAKKIDIIGTLTAGYELNEDATEFIYRADKIVTLATIHGLNKDLSSTSAGATLGTTEATKKVVELKAAALADRNVTIVANTDDSVKDFDTDYKLALDSEVPNFGKTVSEEKLKFDKLTEGTVEIYGIKAKGWAVAEEGKSIAFTAATNKTENPDGELVATINGFKPVAIAEGKTAPETNDITLDKTDADNPAVKVRWEALADQSVTLDTEYTKYQLTLDTTANVAAAGGNPAVYHGSYDNTNKTYGFETVNYWEKVGSSAKYYSQEAKGWTLGKQNEDDTNNNQIVFTGAENGVLLATITNLSNKMTIGKSATVAADNQKYNVIGTGEYKETEAGALAKDNTFVEGVKVASNTVTLSKNVLGTVAGTSGASVITNTTGNNFALALNREGTLAANPDTYVPNADEAKDQNVWELGSTSKYKKVDKESWKLDSGKIVYTAQTAGTVLATITGLNSAVKEEDIAVVEPTTTGEGAEATTTPGTFTLNKNALAKKGVTLTLSNGGNYKLALNTSTAAANATKKVDTPVLSNNKWELNSAKTTAYYKADVTEGYEAANDGKSIFYSTAATNKSLATVTGLNGGDLYVSQDGQHIGTKNEYDEISNALKFGTGDNAKQITLTGEVLGTSKVSVAGNNYTLAIGSGVINSADASATKSGNVWRVSGTTATYKNVNFANYTLETGAKSITYTPESDVTNGAIATIKGLKSGLTVADDGQSIYYGKKTDGTNNTVISFGTDESGVTPITLTGDALTTTDVTLTKNGTDAVSTHKLALTDADAASLAPTRDTAASLSFALVSGTTSSTTSTVNLKGTMKAGWTLASTGTDANKKITYSAADTNHIFATITGLKKDLKSANISGASAGIKVTNPTDATPTISLDMTVLDTAQVALDDNGIKEGFSFSLDDTSTNAVNDSSSKEIQVWEVSGTTATFKKVNEAYYTLGKKTVNNADKENVTVSFYKRTDVGTIASISNLKSGLKVEDDKIAGIDLGTDGKTFTISGDVLDKKNSTITPTAANIGEYVFKIDADLKPVDGKKYWKVSGTTATYNYDTTEGYTLSEGTGNTNQTITYSTAKTGDKATVVAKIEGLKSSLSESNLKSGITVGKVTTVSGAEVFTANSEEGNIFKVSASVLDTDKNKKAKISSTTLTGDKVPQFRLADDVTVSQTGQNAWSIDSTSGDATLKSNFTTTGYNITGTGSAEITYTKATFASGAAVLATVKGLKSGTTVNEDTGQITGVVLGAMVDKEIELDTDSNGDGVNDTETVQVFEAKNDGTLIQLSKAVLGTDAEKPVTLKSTTAGTYSFALGDNVDAPVYSKKWSYGSGTATLVEGLTAGYAIDRDATELAKDTVDHTVSYYAKDSLTTKIAGIKSGTISADKSTFDGISFVTQTVEQLRSAQQGAGDVAESQTVVVAIPKTGTFQIADSLLQNKTITLTNGNKNATYGVTLATASKIEAPATPVWNKTDSQTTATYTETIAKNNYSQTSDTKVTYSDKDIVNTLATVKGLKKEIVPDENGAIEGIDVASAATTLAGYEGNYTAITLSKNVLGSSEITLTTDKNYYLKLDDTQATDIAVHTADPYFTYNKSKGTATLNGGKTEGWSAPTEEKTISTTAQNGTTTTSKVTARVDLKKLAYTAAVPEPIATVSGLKVNKDNIVEGIEFEKTNTWTEKPTTSSKNIGVITLSGSALDKKDVTVTVSSDLQGKCDLTFALEGDIFEPADEDRVWTADGKGTAKYQYTTTEGYKLDDKSTTLGYSKEKLTVLATITGLDKSVKTLAEDGKKIGTAAEIPGILVSSEPEKTTTGTGANATTKLTKAGVIELQEDSILGSKVKLTSEDYVFALNEDIKSQKFDPEWYLSGTTARYKAGMTAGYDLDDETGGERKTVTKVARTPDKDADAQITIKGLKKGVTLANINDNGIIVNPDNTITLGEAVLGTTDITLENGVQTPASGSTKEVRYAYSFDLSTITQPETQEAEWTLKSGTATLKQKTTAGFTPNTDNTTLTYSKEVTPVVATVKGLDTKLKLTVDGKIAAEDQVVATTETVNKKKVTTYSLKTNADTGAVVGNPAVTFNDNVITLAKDALTTKNVTLINGKDNKGVATAYQLNLGSGITTSEGTATEWVVSGSTANYKNYSPIYYEMETGNTSIKYHAASKGTIYAAVTGLDKKTTTADDLNNANAWSGTQNGGVLTLNAKQLGTSTVKITSKVKGKDTFILALSDSEAEDEKVKLSTVTGKSWSKANNSGKATLTGTLTDGYTLAFGGKSITYLSKNKTNQQLATVTGLAKGASVSDVDGVITLAKSQLTNKNVTVTTTKGDTDYTLSLGDDATALAPTFAASGDEKLPLDKEGNPTDPQVWENPKGTATLKGYVTEEGWTLAESNKAITYTKANAGTKNVALKDEDGKTMKDEKGKAITAPYYKASANLVTVTNLTKGDTPTISDKTVTVAGNDVASGKNNVTANGIGVFEVEFDDKYINKTATGSAVSDKLKIDGTGVSVVGGKGDDYIDLSGSKNTIVYSNGEGNDVIANFDTLKDKLQVKSGTVAVAKSNSDIIVKVGNGSIKLTGIADAVGNTLTVLDKKGNEVEYWVQGSNVSGSSLLADDNYSTDPAQLSSIVEPATTGITPYDIDSGLGLTKDNITPSVTYSGTDKK